MAAYSRNTVEVNPKPFYIPFFTKKVFLSYTFYWQMVPLSHTFFRTLHLLALLEPFTDTNDRFCYPFIYFNKSLKSLPFHILEAWKRYPSRAEPSCIGHHGEYPPHPSGSDITGCLLNSKHLHSVAHCASSLSRSGISISIPLIETMCSIASLVTAVKLSMLSRTSFGRSIFGARALRIRFQSSPSLKNQKSKCNKQGTNNTEHYL